MIARLRPSPALLLAGAALLLVAAVEALVVQSAAFRTHPGPLAAISGVRRGGAGAVLEGEDGLSTAAPGPPAVVLELARPVRVEGPFGLSREVVRLGVPADDPEALVAALQGDARG